MVRSIVPDGVRIGVAPLSWTNDVLEELGGDISIETCLNDAAENGFEGIELGRKFPRDANTLGQLLADHGLKLVSGWYSGFLTERAVSDEMNSVADHAQLLNALGADTMVYGPVGLMAENALDIPMAQRLVLDRDASITYADRLAEFENRLQGEFGLKLAYHHHLMMVLETFDEICCVVDRAQCGLLVDTGHAYAAGFDYAKLFERFGDLVTHIHLKDVREDRLLTVRDNDLSFNEGVRRGMFTVPGDGVIDFAPVADFVKKSGYQGWLVVEAEQDPSKPEAEPKSATKRAFDTVMNLF